MCVEETTNNNRIEPQKDTDASILLKTIAWVSFGLNLVPLLPSKTALAVLGTITGYVYKKDYGGTNTAFIANLSMLLFRITWIFVIILLLILAT